MKPDFAFYCPDQYWLSPDRMKNLILFFDGIHFNQDRFLGPRNI